MAGKIGLLGLGLLGIPRATASTAGVREKVRTTSDSESDSEKPFYSIHKVTLPAIHSTVG